MGPGGRPRATHGIPLRVGWADPIGRLGRLRPTPLQYPRPHLYEPRRSHGPFRERWPIDRRKTMNDPTPNVGAKGMKFRRGFYLAVLVAGLGARAGLAKEARMQWTSSAWKAGGPIPSAYTCDGANVSPPLARSDAPAGTKSFALIADDPDAPGKTWVHWLLWNLPPETNELKPGTPPAERSARRDHGFWRARLRRALPAGWNAPLLFQALRARCDAHAQGRRPQGGARSRDERPYPRTSPTDGDLSKNPPVTHGTWY